MRHMYLFGGRLRNGAAIKLVDPIILLRTVP